MDKAIRLAKIEAQQKNIDAVTEALKSGIDVIKILAANKTVALVVSVALLEAIRGIKVNKGATGLVYSGQSHVQVEGPIAEPLFPAALVSTLEGVIIAKEALSGLSATDLAGLAGALKGLL
jgi:hypothetical protein